MPKKILDKIILLPLLISPQGEKLKARLATGLGDLGECQIGESKRSTLRYSCKQPNNLSLISFLQQITTTRFMRMAEFLCRQAVWNFELDLVL